MGTGAYMTLQNSTSSTLISTVASTTCMYQNGDDGSQLQQFNTTLAPGESLDKVYIEANGNLFAGCAFTQSQFTLGLSSASFNGSVTLNLGSGTYNTSVVGNTAPGQIGVSIGPHGAQYSIDILVTDPTSS